MTTPNQVLPKNPALALLASFFIPGLGQFVNGEAGKGALLLALYVVSWLLCFALVGFVLLPAVWVWGMVDAYTAAKGWNAQHGIVS